jgi:hypothetical protein
MDVVFIELLWVLLIQIEEALILSVVDLLLTELFVSDRVELPVFRVRE